MKMSKNVAAVLINDVHLDKNNGELVESIFKQAEQVCIKNDCYFLICSGDVFTNRSAQPLDVLKVFKRILKSLRKKGIAFYSIPGNHDKTNPDSNSSYLDLYNKEMKVINTPSILNINGVDFTFIPYYSEAVWEEYFEEISGKIDQEAVNIMVTHRAFNGVKNNDGSVVETEFKNSKLKIFNKVLVGHYHNASKVGENIYYTGSAYQNNYGETIEDKGFTLIYDDGELEFVESEFIQYLKIVMDINDSEIIRENTALFSNTGHYVRFVFRGKKVDCDKINISELNAVGIEVKFETEEQAQAIEISEAESIMSHNKGTITKDFLKFSSENGIKGDKLKYGLELIKNFI